MIKVRIFVSLKTSVFDPSSKMIYNTMLSLGYKNIVDIKENKYYELIFDETDVEIVKLNITKLCDNLLVNPNTEKYTYELIESFIANDSVLSAEKKDEKN